MKKNIIFALLLILTACSTSCPIPADDPTGSLPCSNKIVPAKTTKDEAIQIVNALEIADKDKMMAVSESWGAIDGIIRFEIGSNDFTKNSVNLFWDGDKIVVLSLSGNLRVTFGEMIETTGNPESIYPDLTSSSKTNRMAVNLSRGIGFAFLNIPIMIFNQKPRSITWFYLPPSYFEKISKETDIFTSTAIAEATRLHTHPWKEYGVIDELYPPAVP